MCWSELEINENGVKLAKSINSKVHNSEIYVKKKITAGQTSLHIHVVKVHRRPCFSCLNLDIHLKIICMEELSKSVSLFTLDKKNSCEKLNHIFHVWSWLNIYLRKSNLNKGLNVYTILQVSKLRQSGANVISICLW